MKRCPGCDVSLLPQYFCLGCSNCLDCCDCQGALFDADELGLDPETDRNTDRSTRDA